MEVGEHQTLKIKCGVLEEVSGDEDIKRGEVSCVQDVCVGGQGGGCS